MDPLSDVLSLLKVRSYRTGGSEIEGDLSLRFGQHDGVKCYAVAAGECWLAVEGVAETVHLTDGDCFLLPRGLPFILSTNVATPPRDAMEFLAMARSEAGVTLPGDGCCSIVGGHFALSGSHATSLMQVLPPIVHIRSEADKAELRWSLHRMREEMRQGRPGSDLLAQQLAYMLLVLALRLHLEDTLSGGVGWLFALADQQMNAAMTAIHADPGHRWTLQNLAERAGVSRSIFAQRFKQTVGTTAMEYLTRWRMMLAADRLIQGGEAVSLIALSLGYESESAFSKAFKKVMGLSPRQYSRGRTMEASADEESRPTSHLAIAAD